MSTIWDWVTVFIFAGLATLLVQRSMEEEPRDKLWQYAPPSIGCALANYLGNNGQPVFAGAIVIGVVIYIFIVLKVKLPGV